MAKKICFTLLLLLLSLTAGAIKKYVGGDISLLTKYEEHGAVYYNQNGTRITDMLSYLNTEGMNSMRLRLFVDPSKAGTEDQREGVCQDLPYVKALGKRIKDAGLSLMLDIHYSDTWTDPGQHSTPSSWTVTSSLADSVYSYTRRVLNAMVAAGATPDFIQVGNEVTYGMMWPTGYCYPSGANYGSGSFATFANYLKQGIKASREVCPQAKIIVHTEMGRVSNVTSFYNTLKGYTNDYDIIGLSYYPYWHGDLTVLNELLNTLEETYPTKLIQIVETGYPHAYYPSDASYDLQSIWPATPSGQASFCQDLVQTLNAHSRVNGLYWWFPEANEYGINYTNSVTSSWYNCGWWDNATGRVMNALFAATTFMEGSTDEPVEPADTTSIFIVGGEGNWSLTQPMGEMYHLGNGIYVDTITVAAPIYFTFADGNPDEWNDDWDVFNSTYRFGPSATTTVNVGVNYTTAKRNNSYSYYFAGDGSQYLVTFDLYSLNFKLEVIEQEAVINLGDVNDDGVVDVSDVTALITVILGGQVASLNELNADVVVDGSLDVADVTAIIEIILAQ